MDERSWVVYDSVIFATRLQRHLGPTSSSIAVMTQVAKEAVHYGLAIAALVCPMVAIGASVAKVTQYR